MNKNKIYIPLVSFFLIYAILGFVAIPNILKPKLEDIINENITQKATIGKINFNPFLLTFSIENFAINEKDKQTLSIQKIYVDFSLFKSIEERHLRFKNFEIINPVINIVEYEDNSFNFEKLVKVKPNQTEKEENKKESDIDFKINKAVLQNATINFEKSSYNLKIKNLNYTFYDFGTFNNSLASHSLNFFINENTIVNMDGGLRLSPFKIYGNLAIDNLKPTDFLSYKKDILNFDLNEEANINLKLGYQVETQKDFTLLLNKTDLEINELSFYQNNSELFYLDKIKLEDFNLDYPKNIINIASLSIDKFKSKLNTDKNGEIKIASLIKEENKNETINEKNESKPNSWILKLENFDIKDSSFNLNNTKDKLTINSNNINLNLSNFIFNDDIKIEKILLDKPNFYLDDKKNKTNISTKDISVEVKDISYKENSLKILTSSINNPDISIILGKQAKTKGNEEVKKLSNVKENKKSNFEFDIGPVKINNMKMTFQDKNLPIPFKTDITKLNGEFSRLHSSSSKPTKLQLEGKVDEYGYTKISGTVDINDIKLLTDTNLLFKNIAIKNFTPYSGKFVGREIESGKLDLDLKYNIKKSDLNAQNSIIISDIKLGKKVDSPDAVNLPLELAIALLENSDGVIDLELPISGNVDDPQFSIAPIVWKVFTNLIVKAISAPFTLLAAIFGFDEEKIKSVDFEFGKDALLVSEKETLDNVSKILSKKQKLAISLNPTYHETKDKLALQNIKFDIFLEKKMKKMPKGDEYLEALEEIYKGYKLDKKLEDIKKDFIIEDKSNKKILDVENYVEHLRSTLALMQEIKEQELIDLANRRVENIVLYLTKEKQLPKESIKIEDIKKKSSSDEKWTIFDLNIKTR